jgi:tetratricopeptide (TPR) repeat protein
LGLRRNDEALATFEQALNVEPGNPWVLTDVALGLQLQDDYAGALEALDKALALDPDNVWALSTKGEALCDIAEYQDAAQVLDRATQLDPSDARSFAEKGWALENLGAGYAQEARQAYEAAIKLEHENLWHHKGLANALRLLGDTEAAQAKYHWVIEQAEKRTEVDADTMSLTGWCHYQLGHYDEAARLFIEALSLNADMVSTQFDLALALMCSERHSLALQEYQRGLELVKGKQVQRRRGLLYVALDDLREAVKAQSALAEVKEVQEGLELLKRAFDEATVSMAGAG